MVRLNGNTCKALRHMLDIWKALINVTIIIIISTIINALARKTKN